MEEGVAIVKSIEKNSTLLWLKIDQNPLLAAADIEAIEKVNL